MATMKPPTITPRGARQRLLVLLLPALLTLRSVRREIRPLRRSSNSKKRRLAWIAKSLMAPGVDVKFPDGE